MKNKNVNITYFFLNRKSNQGRKHYDIAIYKVFDR